jgi:hypothetical protein
MKTGKRLPCKTRLPTTPSRLGQDKDADVGVATFPTLQNWRLQRLARAPLVEIQMPSGSFFLEAHEVSNEQYTICTGDF